MKQSGDSTLLGGFENRLMKFGGGDMKIGESDVVRGVGLEEAEPLSNDSFSPYELEAECVLVDIYDEDENDDSGSRAYPVGDSGYAFPSIPLLLIGFGLIWLVVSNMSERR
jgi:hypothetical protein